MVVETRVNKKSWELIELGIDRESWELIERAGN
jgi:hypothetical protein